MAKSGENKEKQSKHGEASKENVYDGSAARTRPLSFCEIMHRRKGKGMAEHVKHVKVEAGMLSVGGSKEDLSEHCNSGDRRYRHPRDSSKHNEKLPVEEPVDAGYRKKEGSTVEENISKQKNREERSLGSLRKVEMKTGISTRHKEMCEEPAHSNKKMGDKAGHAFEDDTLEAPKKRLKSLVVMEAPRDGSDRKAEKEQRRKYRNGEEQRFEERRDFKKHDIEKARNYIPERDDKRERAKLHHDDLRAQRRRSRSRDRLKGRYRSCSRSPRVRKIITHRHKEYEELSAHSSRDKRERHHHDSDRNRRARHSTSGSGLGGYSPRKRREEAPAKTSSPPKQAPEKKTPKWDLTPAVTGSIITGTNILGLQSELQLQSLSVNAVTSTALDPLTIVSLRIPPIKQNADAVQLTESTRPMRRLYVESLPDTASEKSLMECFNNYLLSSGFNHIQGSEPCISCIINKEKGQALVEFLTPEDASSALSFNGRSFAGSALKVRRPKDFVDVATSRPEKSQADVKVSTEVAADAALQTTPLMLTDNVEDSSNKIFIGGISKAITPDMLKEIANVFGPLKAYRFELNDDLGEPCAFLEYVDPSITPKACGGLNGMKLGGKAITAVQAFPDPLLLVNKKSPTFYGIPEHAKPLLCEPTQVLKFKNVFDSERFPSLSEPEIEETLEDVRMECSRFGSVKSINVVKDKVKRVTASGASVNDHPEAGSDDTVMGENPQFSELQSEEINAVDTKSNDKESDRANGQEINSVDMQSSDMESRGTNDEEINTADTQSNYKESERANEVAYNDSMADEDEPCRPRTSTAVEFLAEPSKADEEAIAEEPPNPTIASNVEVDQGARDVHEGSRCNSLGTKTEGNTGSDLDRSGGKTQEYPAGPARCDGVTPETSPRKVDANSSQDRNLEHIFEPGCVFVEFRRTEASCAAAHSLHGRLFDNRTVSVEYIDLDDYRTRFQR